MSDCAHRWIIATPDGPESEGKCRKCGEVKAFKNSNADYSVWEGRGYGKHPGLFEQHPARREW